MKIIPLYEGVYAVDKKKVFTALAQPEQAPAAAIRMGICPFLVETATDLVLLDTGLGTEQDGHPDIVQLVENAGYQAAQVNKILLSHLHKDHIEGIGQITGDKLVPSFPNARVYLQQREFEFALQQTGTPSYNFPLLEKLPSLPEVEWMQDDQGQITEQIRFLVTGGHSPFHQVFWIEEAGEKAFYGADNLPQRSYLKFHIAYKSDYDGKRAMEQRQEWEKAAKEEHWTVLFYHNWKEHMLKF